VLALAYDCFRTGQHVRGGMVLVDELLQQVRRVKHYDAPSGHRDHLAGFGITARAAVLVAQAEYAEA
jgi:hypothetical protein